MNFKLISIIGGAIAAIFIGIALFRFYKPNPSESQRATQIYNFNNEPRFGCASFYLNSDDKLSPATEKISNSTSSIPAKFN